MGALLPMNIFLRQEIDRIKKVIGIVQKTLCDLKLAIDGTIVMSQGLRESLDAMYDARIPQKWQKVIKIIKIIIIVIIYYITSLSKIIICHAPIKPDSPRNISP